MDALRSLLGDGIVALMGPSGVGKSSLLNALDPELELRVGELSWKTRRGRHTTVSGRLVDLRGGGRVADTPGIGDVGLWRVDKSDVDLLFPELAHLREECRFRSCSHFSEPGCAVREAVQDGRVSETRFASYGKLREEATG